VSSLTINERGTPREVVRLMARLIFLPIKLLSLPQLSFFVSAAGGLSLPLAASAWYARWSFTHDDDAGREGPP
jgi:hypothetical protein